MLWPADERDGAGSGAGVYSAVQAVGCRLFTSSQIYKPSVLPVLDWEVGSAISFCVAAWVIPLLGPDVVKQVLANAVSSEDRQCSSELYPQLWHPIQFHVINDVTMLGHVHFLEDSGYSGGLWVYILSTQGFCHDAS